MPKDVKYFPKEAGQVFNPGRNKYEENPFGDESRYVTHWKRGFFRLYGKKGGGSSSFIVDPYVKAVAELSLLRDGKLSEGAVTCQSYDSANMEGSSYTYERTSEKYHPDSSIKSHIGGLDILNPLVPLSLLCITLSRAMSLKGDDLKDAGKTGRNAALKFFQYTFNALLTLPLTAVALLTTFLWDAVKAIVAAVTMTFSSMVTAPVEAARGNRYVVELC